VITGAPLDIVAVDVLSGLPATADGKKYVLVLTDYFTKWACAFARSARCRGIHMHASHV